MLWRRRLQPLIRPFYQAYARRSRGMTLGVRVLAFNADGQVRLIEHTYTAGWHLPGGGVERGESAEEAAARELAEEAGLQATATPRLLSIHLNRRGFKGDHTLVYRVDAWEPCAPRADWEILEAGWFALDALPAGTTPFTRSCIAAALDAPR